MENMWMYFGIGCLVFAAVVLFLTLWKRREDRRYRAVALAATFKSWGLEAFAELFQAYAVGNYIGEKSVGRVFRKLIEQAVEEGLPIMMTKTFWLLLKHFLTVPDMKEKIVKLVTASGMESPDIPADPVPPATSEE